MILAELPNSLAIAVISNTWRVERLFNNVPLPTCFIIQLYNHPQLYTFRPIVPVRLYKHIMAVGSFPAITVNPARYTGHLWKRSTLLLDSTNIHVCIYRWRVGDQARLTRSASRCGLGVLQHNNECLCRSQNAHCLYGRGQNGRAQESEPDRGCLRPTGAPRSFGMVTPAISISDRVVRVRMCTPSNSFP